MNKQEIMIISQKDYKEEIELVKTIIDASESEVKNITTIDFNEWEEYGDIHIQLEMNEDYDGEKEEFITLTRMDLLLYKPKENWNNDDKEFWEDNQED